MPSFNLLDQPWIPCVPRGGGTVRELSLRDALAQAHEMREIADPSPLITVALHRLLLAVLHRCFGPEEADTWARLRDRGAWDAAVLDDYFDHWHERFDLFDDARPFYQTASLDFRYTKTIANLAPELASPANSTTLFDHTVDASLTPAEAARHLVAFHAFAVGGLVSLEQGQDAKLYKSAKAAPLAKRAVALARGETLFETLLYNLNRYNPADEVPFPASDRDQPAWERDTEPQAADRVPEGYLDLLTWQSRRIRLEPETQPDGQIVVPRVVIMKGDQFPDGWSQHGHETMLAFIRNPRARPNEDPFPAVSFQEDRAVWRDSVAILQYVPDKEQRTRPVTLEWLAELAVQGYVDPQTVFPLDFFGMTTNQANVLFWRRERLPVPVGSLRNAAFNDALAIVIRLAEDVGERVRWSAQDLARLLLAPESDAPDARQPDKQAVAALRQSIGMERRYWAQLDAPFRSTLVGLAAEDEPGSGGALANWAADTSRAARQTFQSVAVSLDGSARTLKAAATTERRFNRNLNQVLEKFGIATKGGPA